MNVVKLIELIVITIGVMLVYDARPIAKKRFGFGSENEGAKTLKIVGFVLAIIGGIALLF